MNISNWCDLSTLPLLFTVPTFLFPQILSHEPINLSSLQRGHLKGHTYDM